MNAGDWAGRSLGERVVHYTERDAILYALAVGARPDELDLVFEDRLRVLPTFALTLAQWAPDALGVRRAFDPATAVHGAQRLRVLSALPPSGRIQLSARVAAVWDKGTAAVFDVDVESEHFIATWSIFAPGRGGFGGERGPAAPRSNPARTRELTTSTQPNQAVLYRLLGDRHAMHVDPEAARAAGQPRPFLHGLCTLAAITLDVARDIGVHPADLTHLAGRFAAPVFPGDRLAVHATGRGPVDFEATTGDRRVITGGSVSFGDANQRVSSQGART